MAKEQADIFSQQQWQPKTRMHLFSFMDDMDRDLADRRWTSFHYEHLERRFYE